MRMLKRSAAALAAAALWVGASTSANATLSFSLVQGNGALAGDPTPFGTVTVTWVDTTHATVSLVGLTQVAGANTYVYSFGDGGTLGLNLDLASGASVMMTGLSLTSAGHGGTPEFVDVDSGNEDGFGSFNFKINLKDGWHQAVSGLSFGLTLSGDTWANENEILKPNNNGYQVAAHVFPTLNGADQGIKTGFATTAVPEPSTYIAGALLLLPFGASTIRMLRKNRTA